MKTLKILTSILALTVATSLSGAAHAQVGIAGGLNFDSFGDIETTSAKGTFDSATGYHFGVFFDLNAAPIAVRPGVFIRDAGEVAFRLQQTDQKFSLTFIEVPIDVRIPLLQAPLVSPYLLGGPVFSFPRSGNEEFDNSLEDLAISGSVGAGVSIMVPGAGIRLYPELRYAFGLSGFLKDSFEVAGVTVAAENTVRLSAVMLRLGIGL